MKTFLRIVKWVGLALFAGVVVLTVFVSVTWNKDWDVLGNVTSAVWR